MFLGVALAVYNVLDFRSGKYCEHGIVSGFGCSNPISYYYYGTDTKILLAIASLLIVWQLVIWSNLKNNK